jgi:hypothetical protein
MHTVHIEEIRIGHKILIADPNNKEHLHYTYVHFKRILRRECKIERVKMGGVNVFVGTAACIWGLGVVSSCPNLGPVEVPSIMMFRVPLKTVPSFIIRQAICLSSWILLHELLKE